MTGPANTAAALGLNQPSRFVGLFCSQVQGGAAPSNDGPKGVHGGAPRFPTKTTVSGRSGAIREQSAPESAIDVCLAAIARYRFNFVSESDLHDALAGALVRDGIEFEREVILSPRDRIDFLIGTVGVEVKVDGSSAAVERQVRRYTESDRISAVVLLTSCSRHASIQRSLNGKPVHVVPTFRA